MLKKLFLPLMAALLTACSVIPGPVVIRESSSPVVIDEPAPVEDPDNVVVNARPISPDQSRQSIPVVDTLAQQADNQLEEGNFDRAIDLAEKGLRIDRKDPRFYLVLASAYHQLNDKSQSASFAKQGLRYVNQNSGAYQQLKWFSQ